MKATESPATSTVTASLSSPAFAAFANADLIAARSVRGRAAAPEDESASSMTAVVADAIGIHRTRPRTQEGRCSRIGRSTSRNDATATTPVTASRSTQESGAVEPGASGGEQHVQRPVPEVQAVGDQPDGRQRLEGEQTGQTGRGAIAAAMRAAVAIATIVNPPR